MPEGVLRSSTPCGSRGTFEYVCPIQTSWPADSRTGRSQRLYDRMWFFVTESLLAFTIFRDQFDTPFVVMFVVLLFLKCFHWILADRIDWVRHA